MYNVLSITASFAYHSNPFIFIIKKRIFTKYLKHHMKQDVSQATELIKLNFLLFYVYMLLLQQSHLTQITSHLTTLLYLSFNLSYLQKPPQNPRFTECSQTLLPVSQSHETFKTTSAVSAHLPNPKSFSRRLRTTLKTTACQAHFSAQ